MRAVDLTAIDPGESRWMMRESDDAEGAWKTLQGRPRCEMWPSKARPGEPKFLPQMVTVDFTDGSSLHLNPDDHVELGWA
jgi:hypothetical protein